MRWATPVGLNARRTKRLIDRGLIPPKPSVLKKKMDRTLTILIDQITYAAFRLIHVGSRVPILLNGVIAHTVSISAFNGGLQILEKLPVFA